MNTLLLPVQHPALRPHIQSFLFFSRTATEPFTYTTFPNTNLCLALYQYNQITYTRTDSLNHCQIGPGNSPFASRLYGFHQKPFTVAIEGPLDQICILFRAGGLRAFTHERFAELRVDPCVAESLFPGPARQWLEPLFWTKDPHQRVRILEALLLHQLMPPPLKPRLQSSLQLIENNVYPLTVNELAKNLCINESTLYRLFVDQIGQSPKAYCQTVRFRQALIGLLAGAAESLTQRAYTHHYFDQAHYGHHLKRWTGHSPGQLAQKLTVEQNQLVWVTNQASLA
ncbi:helix-turn-helix domain-containing protein [Spirosoma fluminis]